MATTVIYKDNTLTTLGNGDTKTLKTAGTYLEDDIEISENLNLQTKTVTPTTSQQIVTANKTINGFSKASYSYDTTSMAYTYSTSTISTECLNQTYVRINGTYKISSYSNTNYWRQFNFNNAIFTVNSLTYPSVIYLIQNGSIQTVNGISQTTGSGGGFLPYDVIIEFNSNTFKIILHYQSSPSSSSPVNYSITNFSLDFSNDINFNENYEGLSQVTVEAIPSNYVIPTGTKTITSNGTGIDVAAYATVDVNVVGAATPTYQSKSVTPTESSQTVTADSGYDALSSVTVGAISSTYVGSGITQRTASDITFTKAGGDAYYTIPAGYYASKVEEDLLVVGHPNPTVSVNSSTGLITASHTQTSGYVYTGGTTTGTSQLSVQAATTITPTTSSQTAVAAGKYTTGAVTVGPIPSNYVDSTTLRTYRSGTSAPASSLGNNGDIYLQLAQ